MKHSHKICVAPMLGYTDRHFRYLIRLITRHAFLYSEMVVAKTLMYKEPSRWLDFNEIEHPIGLQLAGNDPKTLAKAAKIGEKFGYEEINFNVGCPSPRVQSGQFGCCLLAKPNLVLNCFKAMQDAVSIPVTIKTRLGLLEKHQETQTELEFMYKKLTTFIESLKISGCQTFIIHARWANLKKFSPKQNRTLPPLHHESVYQLKKDFPNLDIILNGGIKNLYEHNSLSSYKPLDGIMIGTAAYHNPYMLIDVDETFYKDPHPKLTQQQIAKQYLDYINNLESNLSGPKPKRHLQNLFRSIPNRKSILEKLTSNLY